MPRPLGFKSILDEMVSPSVQSYQLNVARVFLPSPKRVDRDALCFAFGFRGDIFGPDVSVSEVAHPLLTSSKSRRRAYWRHPESVRSADHGCASPNWHPGIAEP